MNNKEEGGQEFANQDKAIVDSEGNVFGLQGIDIPERPKDLLADMDKAQAAAQQLDKYGGATVWVCDEGPGSCGNIQADPGHTVRCGCGDYGDCDCGWYVSHEYKLSELEAGTAKVGSEFDPKISFQGAKASNLVPSVDQEWKKWHGG